MKIICVLFGGDGGGGGGGDDRWKRLIQNGVSLVVRKLLQYITFDLCQVIAADLLSTPV